jgi:hypothetical protein
MSNLALVEWKKDVLETAADRFERRLTEESAALRLDMANMRAEFKSDMGRLHGSLIKWMFVFWIGQLGITLTIVGVVLRAVRLL